MPKALENRPVLDDRLSFFYGLFSELNDDRDYAASGAPLPLKLRDFASYCDFWQIPQEDRTWLWGVLRIFDRVWLKIQMAKESAKMESATKT